MPDYTDEDVQELVDAVVAYEAWWDRDCDSEPYEYAWHRLRAALAPFTQEPRT